MPALFVEHAEYAHARLVLKMSGSLSVCLLTSEITTTRQYDCGRLALVPAVHDPSAADRRPGDPGVPSQPVHPVRRGRPGRSAPLTDPDVPEVD